MTFTDGLYSDEDILYNMKSAYYDFWVNVSYHEIPTSKSEGLGL
jgi:hypothetical protein